jgi:hypothetical protein
MEKGVIERTWASFLFPCSMYVTSSLYTFLSDRQTHGLNAVFSRRKIGVKFLFVRTVSCDSFDINKIFFTFYGQFANPFDAIFEGWSGMTAILIKQTCSVWAGLHLC